MILWISSCKSIPYKPLYQYSFQFNQCIAVCYNYNDLKRVEDEKCGPEFVSGEYEAPFCDGIIGPNVKDYAKEIKPALIYNINQCNDARDEY